MLNRLYNWLFNPTVSNSLANQLAKEKAQNRLLQVALTEALAASQELCRQNQISMDRVITNKFDPPYVPQEHEPIINHSLPQSSLSDLIDMDPEDFVRQ
jgi:hypothetical protein